MKDRPLIEGQYPVWKSHALPLLRDKCISHNYRHYRSQFRELVYYDPSVCEQNQLSSRRPSPIWRPVDFFFFPPQQRVTYFRFYLACDCLFTIWFTNIRIFPLNSIFLNMIGCYLYRRLWRKFSMNENGCLTWITGLSTTLEWFCLLWFQKYPCLIMKTPVLASKVTAYCTRCGESENSSKVRTVSHSMLCSICETTDHQNWRNYFLRSVQLKVN